MEQVTLYVMDSCGGSRIAKGNLKRHRIKHTLVDIDDAPHTARDMELKATPTLVITKNGVEKRYVGYSKEAYKKLRNEGLLICQE